MKFYIIVKKFTSFLISQGGTLLIAAAGTFLFADFIGHCIHAQ